MRAASMAEFRRYHQRVHARTARLLPLVPDDRFEWRPGTGRLGFGDLIRHLAASERYLFVEIAIGRPSRYPGHGRELAAGPERVRRYYHELHRDSLAALTTLDDDGLLAPCHTPTGAAISRWKWLRSMLEHEIHHRGQLYLLLGLCGVPTPPLFGLTSEEVRAASQPPEP